MQKLKLLIPFALFLGVFFVACHEEDPFENGPLANVSFAGRVVDENGDAVQGALVKAGNESSLTDLNGVFRLQSVRLPAMHAVLTVSKPGYFEVSRPYIVQDGALQTITVQLLEKKQVGLISPSAGGSVNVPGGPRLSFPVNAITDANGNPHNGNVRVFARYLDPSDPMLALFLPGDMTAENAAGEEVFLATYGMVGVEIESTNGQKLKIAPGKEVELRMPIISSQLASAPSEIPLWHYDLEEGHWKEEGSAQKSGNEYVGKVAHFSFWNCDAPFPLTQLYGKVFLENTDQPLANACVRLTMLSTGASSFGYTDGNGRFGGCIPKDEPLRLEVVLPENCGGLVLFAQNVGPFSGPATLPDIVIPGSVQVPLVKIKGQLLGCNGQPIVNGYVKTEMGSTIRFLYPGPNGQFDYTMFSCANAPQAGTVVGYDLDNLLESSAVHFNTPPNTLNIGDITVCSTLSEYIQYAFDGQDFIKIDPHGGLDNGTTLVASPDSSFEFISLNFGNNGQLGTFPIAGMSVNGIGFDYQAVNTLTSTVTAYGAVGGLITGDFGGTFLDFNGASHTISGSYRVVRDW